MLEIHQCCVHMRASMSYRINPGCALSGSVCHRQAVQILTSLIDARVAEGSSTVGMKLNPISYDSYVWSQAYYFKNILPYRCCKFSLPPRNTILNCNIFSRCGGVLVLFCTMDITSVSRFPLNRQGLIKFIIVLNVARNTLETAFVGPGRA